MPGGYLLSESGETRITWETEPVAASRRFPHDFVGYARSRLNLQIIFEGDIADSNTRRRATARSGCGGHELQRNYSYS